MSIKFGLRSPTTGRVMSAEEWVADTLSRAPHVLAAVVERETALNQECVLVFTIVEDTKRAQIDVIPISVAAKTFELKSGKPVGQCHCVLCWPTRNLAAAMWAPLPSQESN